MRPEIQRIWDADFKVYGGRKAFAIGLEPMAARWLIINSDEKALMSPVARWRG